MRTIGLVAVAAGLVLLTACDGKEAASNDSLTEGIVINNAEVFANDTNTTDANAAAANATNAADANPANATDADAVTNNAQ